MLKDLRDQADEATTIEGRHLGVPLLGTGIGALAAHMVSDVDNVYSKALAQSGMKNDPISRRAAAEVIAKEYPDATLTELTSDSAARVNPQTKEIMMNLKGPEKGSVLLHEAGHIKSNQPVGMRSLARLGNKLSPLQLMTASALFGNEMGKDEGDREMLLPGAVGLSALAMKAPTLIEELKASHHARQMAKTHGLPKPKGLNRAFLTYLMSPSTLLGAGLAGGAAYGINKLNQ